MEPAFADMNMQQQVNKDKATRSNKFQLYSPAVNSKNTPHLQQVDGMHVQKTEKNVTIMHLSAQGIHSQSEAWYSAFERGQPPKDYDTRGHTSAPTACGHIA